MKKKLTREEEFEIMKLVLDKILWLGFGVMAFGFYKLLTAPILEGIGYVIAGAVILIIFIMMVVRDYEYVKKADLAPAKKK